MTLAGISRAWTLWSHRPTKIKKIRFNS